MPVRLLFKGEPNRYEARGEKDSGAVEYRPWKNEFFPRASFPTTSKRGDPAFCRPLAGIVAMVCDLSDEREG